MKMTEKQEFADRFRKHYHEFITMEISFDDFCDKVFSEIDYQQQVSVEPVVMLPKPNSDNEQEKLAQLRKDGDYYEFDNKQWGMSTDELLKIAEQYFVGMATINGDTCEVKITGRQFAILASYFLHCERP